LLGKLTDGVEVWDIRRLWVEDDIALLQVAGVLPPSEYLADLRAVSEQSDCPVCLQVRHHSLLDVVLDVRPSHVRLQWTFEGIECVPEQE